MSAPGSRLTAAALVAGAILVGLPPEATADAPTALGFARERRGLRAAARALRRARRQRARRCRREPGSLRCQVARERVRTARVHHLAALRGLAGESIALCDRLLGQLDRLRGEVAVEEALVQMSDDLQLMAGRCGRASELARSIAELRRMRGRVRQRQLALAELEGARVRRARAFFEEVRARARRALARQLERDLRQQPGERPVRLAARSR